MLLILSESSSISAQYCGIFLSKPIIDVSLPTPF